MKAQRQLAGKVDLSDNYGPIRTLAGLDVSYLRRGDYAIGIGVAVVLSYPGLTMKKCITYIDLVCIPYIPGLLAFREMAVLGPILSMFNKEHIDMYIVDGHGIAHPRKLGIASHVGVVTNKPSIGVAKKRLYGDEKEVQGVKVLVENEDKILAVILEARRGKKIYVSPGHRISPWTAASLVKTMLRPNARLPEPTRQADIISKEIRRRLKESPIIPFGFTEC